MITHWLMPSKTNAVRKVLSHVVRQIYSSSTDLQSPQTCHASF